MKKIRIDKGQGYLLDNFLRENTKTLNGKRPETIAKVCSTALGFEISPSTIKSIRRAMIFAGIEVWEEAPRTSRSTSGKITKLQKELQNQIAEQDRKFKVVFERLHAIESSVSLLTHEEEKPLDPPSYACSEREILRDMPDENKEMGEPWQS